MTSLPIKNPLGISPGDNIVLKGESEHPLKGKRRCEQAATISCHAADQIIHDGGSAQYSTYGIFTESPQMALLGGRGRGGLAQ